jgi:hypothetical protein
VCVFEWAPDSFRNHKTHIVSKGTLAKWVAHHGCGLIMSSTRIMTLKNSCATNRAMSAIFNMKLIARLHLNRFRSSTLEKTYLVPLPSSLRNTEQYVLDPRWRLHPSALHTLRKLHSCPSSQSQILLCADHQFFSAYVDYQFFSATSQSAREVIVPHPAIT